MNQEILKRTDGMTRREIVKMIAAKCLTLTFVSNVASAETNTTTNQTSLGQGKAKSLILIFAGGGMSQVDSFDIKEANKAANQRSEPIKTNADGIRVGKYFPGMAEHMDRFALINSMQHTKGIHKDAAYLMRTAYELSSTIVHPQLGAWISKYQERRSGAIPPFVSLGGSAGLGNGFFPGKYGALPIGDPTNGLSNSRRPQNVAQSQFQKRLSLTEQLNREFEKTLSNTMTKDYHQAYEDAVSLMRSRDLEVFDLKRESDKTKQSYGKGSFGYSCLLARRLVEHGVNCVTLGHGGWDDHAHIYDEFGSRSEQLDRGVAALMSDLRSRGLLDSTLVAIATEFGRDANINKNGGRGHNPRGYTCLLAGGRIRGGQKYGATDKMGQNAIENIVSPEDFHATIAYAMGMPTEQVVKSSTGRPFTLANKGKPVTALF